MGGARPVQVRLLSFTYCANPSSILSDPSIPARSPRPRATARAHFDRGFRFEQSGLLDRALDAYRSGLAASTTVAEQAEANLRVARIFRSLSNWAESKEASARAIHLAGQAGADDLIAEAMNIEVGALQVQGHHEAADAIATRALDYARSARVRGITLQNLGRGAAERSDFATSDRYFEESIRCFRLANYDLGLAIALGNVARAALDRGDVERAIELGDEAIVLARRLNALDLVLTGVQNQAAAFAASGRHELAEALLTEALGHFTSAGNLTRQAECLEIMGELSARRPEDSETAVRCFARALTLATRASDQKLVDRLTRRLASKSMRTQGE
jgi:tetratricopeptide (TPR) repeat protein